jgi:hypothetical protein
MTKDIHCQIFNAAAGEAQFRTGVGSGIRRLVFAMLHGANRKLQTQAGRTFGPHRQSQRLQRTRGGKIFRVGDFERPQRDRRTQGEPTGDIALELPIGGVEIGAARNGASITQGGVAELRLHLRQQSRRRRREIMRHKLIEKVGREFSEFVFDLELDTRRQERRAFQQSADHRVEPLAGESAKALGDSGIFLRKLAGLLPQQRKLPIVKLKEFAVHARL